MDVIYGHLPGPARFSGERVVIEEKVCVLISSII